VLVHVVFAHPSHDSFTGGVLGAFCDGLTEAGHRYTMSDLYQMAFNPVLDAAQYGRESTYQATWPVPDDVAVEQAKLDAADAWVFVYPVWWTDCPAILKGWFDRVWSVGYAYEPGHVNANRALPQLVASMRPAKLALVLCTAGHTEAELRVSGCYQAMETTMMTDRIATRAEVKRFVVFGGSAELDSDAWAAQRAAHLDEARRLGRNLA